MGGSERQRQRQRWPVRLHSTQAADSQQRAAVGRVKVSVEGGFMVEPRGRGVTLIRVCGFGGWGWMQKGEREAPLNRLTAVHTSKASESD